MTLRVLIKIQENTESLVCCGKKSEDGLSTGEEEEAHTAAVLDKAASRMFGLIRRRGIQYLTSPHLTSITGLTSPTDGQQGRVQLLCWGGCAGGLARR